MKIYLIGFMGSGKTVYGERLAKQLKWDFYDLDQLVEAKAGMTVQAIFQGQGEAYFRKLEKKALRETKDLHQTVIATGGGAPAYHDNIDWMNTHGDTIYLKLLEEKLAKRLKKEKDKRPLIQGMKDHQLQNFISEKLKERSYYYLQAKRVIDPIHVQPNELAKLLKTETTN